MQLNKAHLLAAWNTDLPSPILADKDAFFDALRIGNCFSVGGGFILLRVCLVPGSPPAR
jgi:hypothetical protein